MEKFLAALHVEDITVMAPGTAVKVGFLAWGLLAVSMGLIFLTVLVVNKVVKKKK